MVLKARLPLVVLVDDSEEDNLFHSFVIEQYGLAEELHVELTGERALSYLASRGTTTEATKPTLILLDINMPGISGWEFLERYHALDARHRAQAVVVMLTTSTDPHDRARAEALELRFFSKPLTAAAIDQVVQDLLPQFWDG
ncbi:MAG: response regulator [Vicinamibacterales bacterium]